MTSRIESSPSEPAFASADDEVHPPRGLAGLMNIVKTLRRVEPVFVVALLSAALWVLHHELSLHSWAEIRGDLSGMAPRALLAAGLLTVLNYAILTGYDTLSLHYAEVTQPLRRVALASTLGYALSQALGFPLLTGAPLRVRLYGAWGVEGEKIAKLIAFGSLTFWVGVLGVGGGFLALAGPGTSALTPTVVRMVGALFLLGLGVYLGWVLRGKPSLRLSTVALNPPSPRLAAAQLGVTAADWIVAALVLYVLLPGGHGVPLAAFIAAFIAAQVLGLISHIPGGLGVFEASLLALMPASVSASALFASLVVYRIVYYICPLILAGMGLATFELLQRRGQAKSVTSALSSVLPTTLAAGVFVLGATLLLLGSVPIPSEHLNWISAWLHPAALNVSHFVASLVGAAMIILARGLQRRLKGAYHLALVTLGCMAVLALVTYAAPLVGVVTVAVALALWGSRDRFYRQSSLAAQAFSWRWLVAITTTIAATVWLGIFNFRSVEYSRDLWWQLTLDADAPRFLRATVGIASVLVLGPVARLLRATPTVAAPASPSVLEAIEPIVRSAPRPGANLALLGDKSILVSESGHSFLMYGVKNSSWIALEDPVGDDAEYETLLWRFRDEADRAGDSAVFYQVAPANLHYYVDMGMSLFKLGEEGRVPLTGLTLEGKRWADLRQAMRRFEKVGAQFVIIARGEVRAHLLELRAISDDWLASKNTREKGFSLGRFDDAYIMRNGVAAVLIDAKIVAFATLWAGEAREELSIDLMRYSSEAPKGAMDFVFAHLLLWGRDQGYRYFGLGMAPLAGLESHRLAPRWHRLGDALFDHGERLYNFRGLHDFKEKFGPEWEARYLAVESPRHLPAALADVASLIAGGLKGVFGH